MSASANTMRAYDSVQCQQQAVAAMRHMNEGREQLSHGEFLTRVSPSRISDAQQALRCAHGRHVAPKLGDQCTESKPPHI